MIIGKSRLLMTWETLHWVSLNLLSLEKCSVNACKLTLTQHCAHTLKLYLVNDDNWYEQVGDEVWDKEDTQPPSSTLQDSLKGVLHQFSFQLYFGTSSLEIYLKYTWDIKRLTVPEFSHVGQTNPQDATFAIQITQVVMVRWWAMIACGNFLSRSANTIKRSYIAQLHNVCSLQKGKKSGLV